MIVRAFLSMGLIFMALLAIRARLSDAGGFAGPITGYVTTAMFVVVAMTLFAMIWSKRNFLNDLD